MKLFENLLTSKKTKKLISNPFAHQVCLKAISKKIVLKDNIELLEKISISNLTELNKKTRKYDENLIHLWAMLEMRKYLESYYELTVNPYISDIPIKDLDMYLDLPEKYQNILDIKLIKKVKIDEITYNNLYIVTYEIRDEHIKLYRPYVELYSKTEDGNFEKIGFGYDVHNTFNSVELSIIPLNYNVTLSYKGILELSLKNQFIKLPVYDIINDKKIQKITTDINFEELHTKIS